MLPQFPVDANALISIDLGNSVAIFMLEPTFAVDLISFMLSDDTMRTRRIDYESSEATQVSNYRKYFLNSWPRLMAVPDGGDLPTYEYR